MRIYETVEETISEWSKKLKLRRGRTTEETLKIWSKRLTDEYGRPFIIRESDRETLLEWSKLIRKE